MSINPLSASCSDLPLIASNFFPSNDAIGLVLYPPKSPDFPELKRSSDAPGIAPNDPSTIPNWVNPPAPGESPALSEPIPIPKATPFPQDLVKFDRKNLSNSHDDLPKMKIAIEDQIPIEKVKSVYSSAEFTGFD